MGRPRLPSHRQEAAAAMNPARYGHNMPEMPTSDEIGAPSEWLDGLELECWRWFVTNLWWIKEADRALLELACQLRAKAMTGELGADERGQYLQILSRLGGTPSDRSKIDLGTAGGGQPQKAKRFVE